jgi:hypothetical protein
MSELIGNTAKVLPINWTGPAELQLYTICVEAKTRTNTGTTACNGKRERP